MTQSFGECFAEFRPGVFNIRNEGQLTVKDYSNIIVLIYDKNDAVLNLECRAFMHFLSCQTTCTHLVLCLENLNPFFVVHL